MPQTRYLTPSSMRNIFIFIRRFFVLFVFLVLQVLCIVVLVNYNQTYQAYFAGSANEVIGRVNKQYNDVHEYFSLRKTNEQLAKQNQDLLLLLNKNYGGADTVSVTKLDSVLRDTLGRIRKFDFRMARVVNNSTTEENNYVTIEIGAKQGVTKDMGVLGPNGIVGKVLLVGDNYSVVMSLLNHNSHVSTMLKKDSAGSGVNSSYIDWDGKDASYVVMHNVPKSVKIKNGDTALTSNLSGNFPEGMIVGTVAGITSDPSSAFYILRLKTATNFYNLQYVYLIKNLRWEEQRRLEAQIPKNEP